VIVAGTVKTLLKILQNTNTENPLIEQIIWCFGNIAGDCESQRDYVLECGVMQPILDVVMKTNNDAVMKQSAWALGNLCRGTPRPAWSKVAPALPVLVELLYKKDSYVLDKACWALSYLCSDHDRIQHVIETKGINRLTELLDHASSDVQIGALRVIGSICYSENDSHVQAMLDIHALPKLFSLRDHTCAEIRINSLWTLNNIAAGAEKHIQAVVDAGVVPFMLKLLEEGTQKDEQKKAAWLISNISANSNQVKYLVDQGVIIQFCKLLSLRKSFIALGSVLTVLNDIVTSGTKLYGVENLYVKMIMEQNISKHLKEHGKNEDSAIRIHATTLREAVDRYERLLQETLRSVLKKKLHARDDPFKDCIIFI
jgi:importin subunit alpha-1